MIPEGLKCNECGKSLNTSTADEFVGRPDDFAHRSYYCHIRIKQAIGAAGFKVVSNEFGEPILKSIKGE